MNWILQMKISFELETIAYDYILFYSILILVASYSVNSSR